AGDLRGWLDLHAAQVQVAVGAPGRRAADEAGRRFERLDGLRQDPLQFAPPAPRGRVRDQERGQPVPLEIGEVVQVVEGLRDVRREGPAVHGRYEPTAVARRLAPRVRLQPER